MSTLEDRLSAALAARADLVQSEDLRHAPPPEVVVALHRRPVVQLLAAAACAAVVSVPFLFNGGGDFDPVQPVDTPTPVPPNGDEVAGADWPVIYRYDGYDVDGDGAGDRVVIRNRSGKELSNETRRLEVQRSSGGTTARRAARLRLLRPRRHRTG